MKQAIISLLVSEDMFAVDSGPLMHVIVNFASSIIRAYGTDGKLQSGPMTLALNLHGITFTIVDPTEFRQWSVSRNYGFFATTSPATILDDLITVLCLAQTEHVIGVLDK